ncbi:MAG TPA: hypothetical protein VMG61_06835 [Usitatibacter sp.]|nr:hypothetical protein [Usitatibacter sp.]
MKRLLLLAVAAGLLAGCVESDLKDANNKEWQERTYRTGSNIPSRHAASDDGVATASKDDLDRIRNGSSGGAPSLPMPAPGAPH